MLGQAAAVLVALSTLLALEVAPVGLLAILGGRVAFARSPRTGLLGLVLLLLVHVFELIVVDSAFAATKLAIRRRPISLARQAGRGGGQVPERRRSGRGTFRHGVPTARDRYAQRMVSRFPDGRYYGRDIAGGIRRHTLSARHAVVGNQGAGGRRVGMVSRMGFGEGAGRGLTVLAVLAVRSRGMLGNVL